MYFELSQHFLLLLLSIFFCSKFPRLFQNANAVKTTTKRYPQRTKKKQQFSNEEVGKKSVAIFAILLYCVFVCFFFARRLPIIYILFEIFNQITESQNIYILIIISINKIIKPRENKINFFLFCFFAKKQKNEEEGKTL